MDNDFALGTNGNTFNTKVTEKTTGVGASYTLGSAAVRVLASEGKNIGGTDGIKNDNLEVSLMLAF